MIEIWPNLYIGNAAHFERQVASQEGWAVVHACKEPYHRKALGYRGRGAPREHPEYLIARRGNRLILNLVDAPDPAYIPAEIIEAALEFIHTHCSTTKVLVHCNQGESRAPSIGLLYLAKYTLSMPANLSEAVIAFRQLYPHFHPGQGMWGFIQQSWSAYHANADQAKLE